MANARIIPGKKALLSFSLHPDMARSHGAFESDLNQDFHEILIFLSYPVTIRSKTNKGRFLASLQNVPEVILRQVEIPTSGSRKACDIGKDVWDR